MKKIKLEVPDRSEILAGLDDSAGRAALAALERDVDMAAARVKKANLTGDKKTILAAEGAAAAAGLARLRETRRVSEARRRATWRRLRPSLAVREGEHDAALAALTAARAALARLEREVAGLPERIQRGEARADELPRAIVRRDAAALAIAPAERAVVEAAERVKAEERHAAAALEAEVARRHRQLVEVAEAVSPILTELRELDCALAQLANDDAAGLPGLEWPACRRHEVAMLPMRPLDGR